MTTYGGSNDSADTNHCDPCFILDEIKVDSSSICRECRHQLCDKCVEHHRRTIATRHHNIISFQHTDMPTTQVFQQQPKKADRSGTKPKQVFLTTVRKSHVGTSKHSITAMGRAQRGTTFNSADTHSQAPRTQHQSETPQYEVIGRRVTGSDSVDQDQTGPEVDRTMVWDKDRATDTEGFQDQVVSSSMKNMRLDAGTSDTQTTRQTGKPYTTITLKHSLNVKRENDKYGCYITGLVVLQDKLIVCDYDNSKLKVYDSSYRFLYKYKCDDKPYDIAMLDVNTIIVSAHNMRLLSVGNDSMKEISKINTGYECWGVCCYEGKIYCIVKVLRRFPDFESFSEIRVYARDRKLQHTFEHLSDGKVEYKDLYYITVNPQTGILYVTDLHEGVVLVLSTSGDVIVVISPEQVDDLCGIAHDDHGHIYVCGCWSNNIIQMSPDGGHIKEILSGEDKCKWPWCVKIYGNKMFVVHMDPESNNYKVSIYQLS